MDKKLGLNVILSMGYKLLTLIVPFLTAPYLTRVLGADALGSYTYVQSIASYFAMFAILGIQTYGNRTIARVRDDIEKRSKVFWELYFMEFSIGFIVLIIYALFVLLFSNGHRLLLSIVGIYVISSLFAIDWFCEGMEFYSSIAIRTLCIKMANLACIFLLVKDQNDVIVYCLIMSLGYLVSSIALWPTVKKNIKYIRPSFCDVIKHIKPNLLLFVPAIASSIYQVMDKIMIGYISNEAQLAYYEYADKIIQIPLMLFVSIGTVMLSRMSNIIQNSKEKAMNTIALSMELSFTVGTSCSFGILAIAHELISIYYGPAFLACVPILIALTMVPILYGWSNVIRMQYVIPNGRDSIYIAATFSGAIINLLLNFIFIPLYQAYGATIGTIAAQLVVALVFTMSVRKELPLKRYVVKSIPLFVIGLIMFIGIKGVQHFHEESVIWLIIDIIVGGIIYCLFYLLYGKLSKNNLSSLIYTRIFRGNG